MEWTFKLEGGAGMSVLVKGAMIPYNCHGCFACYSGLCFVAPLESYMNCPHDGKPDWCPLIEVPEHGDLIDRDALKWSFVHGKWDDEYISRTDIKKSTNHHLC